MEKSVFHSLFSMYVSLKQLSCPKEACHIALFMSAAAIMISALGELSGSLSLIPSKILF